MDAPRRSHLILTAGVIAAAVVVLLAIGRAPICECGYVKLWHGLLFYGLLRLVARRTPVGVRLMLIWPLDSVRQWQAG